MLRVGKYDYKTKQKPFYPGFSQELIHIHETLSPYQLEIGGIKLENLWQFSKIYTNVTSQNHQFNSHDKWTHPAEKHLRVQGEPIQDSDIIVEGLVTTQDYWNWRNKGYSWPKAVRYPNGYNGKKNVVCSLWYDGENWKRLNYIEARKQIYFRMYWEFRDHPNMQQLRFRLARGENIMLVEVDGPTFDQEYPYNQVEQGSILITPDILEALINNPKQNFGHGYTIAACLMYWEPK